MRFNAIPALALLVLAGTAHAEGGRIRVSGQQVFLDGEGAPLLLSADAPAGVEVLQRLRRFPGEHAIVRGEAGPRGLVVRELVSPFRNEADLLVTPRPGHPGEVVVRMGDSALRVTGDLLRPFVGREVRVRAWFFMDSYGALPDTCAPVAVLHQPRVGDSVWVHSIDGDVARGRDAEGGETTVAVDELEVGPCLGRPARVVGTLERVEDDLVLVDARGRRHTLGGGEGVWPRDLRLLAGRPGVDLEGTIVSGADPSQDRLFIETVHAPTQRLLTGTLSGNVLRVDGRDVALVGDDVAPDRLGRLVAGLEGQQVTLEGLVLPDVMAVRGVLARATGQALDVGRGFTLPADGQVLIVDRYDNSVVVAPPGRRESALFASQDVNVGGSAQQQGPPPPGQPTQGLTGALPR